MTIEQARDTAREWLDQVRRGIDPAVRAKEQQRLAAQEQLHRNVTSFGAVADEYIARRLRNQRRGHVVAQAIRKELVPHWGDKPLSEITRRDVVKLVEAIVDRLRLPNRRAPFGVKRT